MGGKSIKKWETKWDNLHGSDFDKASGLLKIYAGPEVQFLGLSASFSGRIGRIAKGRMKTNHGAIARASLDDLMNMNPDSQTVTNLLSVLKVRLKSTLIKEDGDLSHILKAIENKTGIAYKDLTGDEYVELYRRDTLEKRGAGVK